MSEVFMNRVFPPMRSAFPKEWEDALQRALDLKAHRYIPGHGFVDGPERSREEMQAFRAAITHIRSEARRLHGPSPDDRPDWGEYASWMLADSQGPIALKSEEHTYELQSLMRTSYDVFCFRQNNMPTSSVN